MKIFYINSKVGGESVYQIDSISRSKTVEQLYLDGITFEHILFEVTILKIPVGS